MFIAFVACVIVLFRNKPFVAVVTFNASEMPVAFWNLWSNGKMR